MRLPDGGRSRAVLLGTSQYASPELGDLPAVRNNLTDLYSILTSPVGTGLPPQACTVLLDQTDVEFLGGQLETVAAQAEDLLLVYYAGHGLVDVKGKLYLTLPRTQRDRLRWTGLPFSHIQDVLLDSPAANRVLILDCCFAGRAIEAMADPQSVVSGQIEIFGTYTLTSTSANAVSHAPVGARHTAFTGHLLNVLSGGAPDPVPLLTLSTIYRSLVRSLSSHGLPRPEQRGTLTADLLALAPNRVAAPVVVPVVQQPVVQPPVAQPPVQSPVVQSGDTRDLLRAEFDRANLTAQNIRDTVFNKPAKGKRGYNEVEVDAFLDRVEAELGKSIEDETALSAADVRNVLFTKPPLGKRGYDELEVDDFLDVVEAEIARRAEIRANYRAQG